MIWQPPVFPPSLVCLLGSSLGGRAPSGQFCKKNAKNYILSAMSRALWVLDKIQPRFRQKVIIGKRMMQIAFARSLNLIFPHTCPSPPVQCEVSPHLKRVVFLLLRLRQRSAACDFSGVEVDRWHTPHLGGRLLGHKNRLDVNVITFTFHTLETERGSPRAR